MKLNFPILLPDHFGNENSDVHGIGGVCTSEVTHGFVPGVGCPRGT